MTSGGFSPTAALPKGWTRKVRPAVLHAISLAAVAWTVARGRNAANRDQRGRLKAELEQAHTEIALLREELGIKDSRGSRLPSRRRPRYTAIERMRILQLKAARRARRWAGKPLGKSMMAFLPPTRGVGSNRGRSGRGKARARRPKQEAFAVSAI